MSRCNKGSRKEIKLTRQLDIMVLHKHAISILAELGEIEMRNSGTKLGQANQFLAVDASGVGENTTSINNSDSLV
jgi:hypothetical protein